MTIGEIMSNVTFLFLGSFGIYAHLKEPNYMLLVDKKRSNYV
jgi:hypothetical protein